MQHNSNVDKKVSLTNICIKRLVGDLKMLIREPLEDIEVITEDDNMLVWYFLIRGPEYSDYKGGYYLGIIDHDPDYPFKPPNFRILTPNGRFIPDDKICLSNSGFHVEEWSSMWNVKTMLMGLLSVMLDDVEHGLAHIRDTPENRTKLAEESIEYNKTRYHNIIKKFANKRFLDESCNPKVNEVKDELS
jgi:ubiquitin-conjugating enzyme E2 J2